MTESRTAAQRRRSEARRIARLDGQDAGKVEPLPHLWIQPVGINGDQFYAGQIWTSTGRAARHYPEGEAEPIARRLPVRMAPLTEQGKQQLRDMLTADLEAARKAWQGTS